MKWRGNHRSSFLEWDDSRILSTNLTPPSVFDEDDNQKQAKKGRAGGQTKTGLQDKKPYAKVTVIYQAARGSKQVKVKGSKKKKTLWEVQSKVIHLNQVNQLFIWPNEDNGNKKKKSQTAMKAMAKAKATAMKSQTAMKATAKAKTKTKK